MENPSDYVRMRGLFARAFRLFLNTDRKRGIFLFCFGFFSACLLSLNHDGFRRPTVSDEYAYLLQAQIYKEGQWVGESPRVPEAFQAQHILTDPVYCSKYPPGQAFPLVLGLFLGHPLIGVWICIGGSTVLSYHLLKRLFDTDLSMVVSLIGCMQFGWMWGSSYFGGAFLMFLGLAFTDLLIGFRNYNPVFRYVGFFLVSMLIVITRPFEGGCFVFIVGMVWLGLCFWGRDWKVFIMSGVSLALAVIAVGAIFYFHSIENKEGNKVLPYYEYHHRYMSHIPLFIWDGMDVVYSEDEISQNERLKAGASDEGLTIGVKQNIRKLLKQELDIPLFHWFIILGFPLNVVLLFFGRFERYQLLVFSGVFITFITFFLSTYKFPHYGATSVGMILLLSGLFLNNLLRIIREHSVYREKLLWGLLIGFTFCFGIPSFFTAFQYVFLRANEIELPAHRVDIAKYVAKLTEQKALILVEETSIDDQWGHWCYNELDFEQAPVLWARDLNPEIRDRLRNAYSNRVFYFIKIESNGYQLVDDSGRVLGSGCPLRREPFRAI